MFSSMANSVSSLPMELQDCVGTLWHNVIVNNVLTFQFLGEWVCMHVQSYASFCQAYKQKLWMIHICQKSFLFANEDGINSL